MKEVLRQGLLYRYIRYRINRNRYTREYGSEEKDQLCREIFRITLPLYLITMLLLAAGFFLFVLMPMVAVHSDNRIYRWYWTLVTDKLYSITQGDWGAGWNKKRATVLLFIFYSLPIAIPVAVTAGLVIIVITHIVLYGAVWRRKIRNRI